MFDCYYIYQEDNLIHIGPAKKHMDLNNLGRHLTMYKCRKEIHIFNMSLFYYLDEDQYNYSSTVAFTNKVGNQNKLSILCNYKFYKAKYKESIRHYFHKIMKDMMDNKLS